MLLSHDTFRMRRQWLIEKRSTIPRALGGDNGVLTGLNLRLQISRPAVTIAGAGSDALFNHPAHGVRHDDFLAELLLLEQLQRAQRRTGMPVARRVSSTRKRAAEG